MDELPPDNFDPYGLTKKPAKRVRNQRQKPQESRDDEPTDDGFFPYHESPPMNDARFSIFFQWVCGVAASLVTIGIVWVAAISVSTAGKVDVLLDRPEPVPRSQYESDMRQIKDDLSDTKSRMSAVERRQIDGIQRGQLMRADE